MIFFALSIIMAAAFFAVLPADVAYHFAGDTPDRWVNRGVFLAWMIVPNILFSLLSMSLIRLVMVWAKYAPPGETPLKELLPLMGNLLALPQLVLFAAMLQLVLYNVYNTSVIPLWILAVVILLIGAVALVYMFMRINRQYCKKKDKTNQE